MINNINNININNYIIRNIIKDLNLNNEKDIVYNMINAYYFKNKSSIFKEVIRLIPEFYILKSNNTIKSKIKTSKIIDVLKIIYRNAELSLTEETEFSIPLLVFNNYYNLSFKYNSNNAYFSNSDIFLYYLTTNDKKRVYEYLNNRNYEMPEYAFEFYNYFILRDLINSIINNYYGYNHNNKEFNGELFIKTNVEKMKTSAENKNKLIDIFQSKINFDYLSNILVQLTQLFNQKEKEKMPNDKKYLDSISVTIMLIYVVIINKRFYLEDHDITNYLNELFRKFYDFIFSLLNYKNIWSQPHLKKIVINLLTPFGLTPIPKESKLFKLYNNFPCFVLNKNSFIFLKEIQEKKIFNDNYYSKLKYFESELDNYIVSYDDAINLLRNLISQLLLKLYYQKYDIIEYPIIPIMNEKVVSKFNKNKEKEMPLYFNLLFYICTISQEENEFDSKYISNVGKTMISIKPLINYNKFSYLFDIEHYLLSLFYYDLTEKDILLKTYLYYFEPKFIDKNFLGKTI